MVNLSHTNVTIRGINITMSKKMTLFILTISLLIMTTSCSTQQNNAKEQDLLQVKSMKSEQKKKVIYLLVDSLMAQSIDTGIEQDILPTMKYLIEHWSIL